MSRLKGEWRERVDDSPTPASDAVGDHEGESQSVIYQRSDSPFVAINTDLDFHLQPFGRQEEKEYQVYRLRRVNDGERTPPRRRPRTTCPTCQGTGRLPLSDCDELTALIPSSDRRLKPRRTKLYVFIGVAVTLCLAFLLAFFLFPRSPSVSVVFIPPSLFTIPSTKEMDFMLNLQIKIGNHNYFILRVKEVRIIMSQVRVFAADDLQQSAEVGARSWHTVVQQVNGSIKGEEATKTIANCIFSKFKQLFLSSRVDVTTEFLGTSLVSSHNIFQFFDCPHSS